MMKGKKDWSKFDEEGSGSDSIKDNHSKVERDIDQSLRESQKLKQLINAVPKNQDVILWLKNVAYSVTIQDMEAYLKNNHIVWERIFMKDQGVCKIFLTHDNAIKLVSIPDNVLAGRRVWISLDSRQNPNHTPGFRQEPARHTNSLREQTKVQYKEKTQPVEKKPESEPTDELFNAFKALSISPLNQEIIRVVKGLP